MEPRSVGPDTIDAEWFPVPARQRVWPWSAVDAGADQVPPLVSDTMVLVITDAEPPCYFVSFKPPHVEELASIMYRSDRVSSGSTLARFTAAFS